MGLFFKQQILTYVQKAKVLIKANSSKFTSYKYVRELSV